MIHGIEEERWLGGPTKFVAAINLHRLRTLDCLMKMLQPEDGADPVLSSDIDESSRANLSKLLLLMQDMVLAHDEDNS